MSWTQIASWTLVLIGIVALLLAATSSRFSRIGPYSRRRLLFLAGAVSLVLAAGIFVAVTVYFSSRSMPV